METAMQTAIERIAFVSFIVIGLSHIVQPRVWVEFFIMIREKGTVGALINGFIHIPMGLLIVGFHNVWRGPAMVLTILGWCWVFKGAINFIIPQAAMKTMNLVSRDKPQRFVWAGFVLLALAGVVGYSLVRP